MSSSPNRVVVVIPADDPVQIGDSSQLDRLRDRCEVRIHRDRPANLEDQIRRVANAEVLLNSRGQVRWQGEALRQLPQLKMITTCSIGTDSIDLEAASQQGIVVSNIPGRTAPVVAEHALALMLAAARRVAYQTRELKSGRWTRMENIYLAGKTLGVVGTGAIGAEVARLARAIGIQVVAWSFNPSPDRAERLGVRFVELDELLATSDVVSVHVRLSPESRGLSDAAALNRMKRGAILVNTARGPVVDSAALVDALQSGHLAGAALDVFDMEPLAEGDPILDCEQVVLTPHAADQTPEGIELLNYGAVDNIIAFLDGKPQNVVNG